MVKHQVRIIFHNYICLHYFNQIFHLLFDQLFKLQIKNCFLILILILIILIVYIISSDLN